MTILHYRPTSRWNYRRVWIGYASFVSLFTMPLARFFYGETHKWFFRTAATVLTFSFVAAINIRFEGDARWVSYLSGFGVVSLVYWLIYAPSKWATQDNLFTNQPESYDRDIISSAIGDPLLSAPGQKIIHQGAHPDKPIIPLEVQVLQEYIRLNGRYKMRGTYTHTRQWSPPGYWRGNLEYKHLINAVLNCELLTLDEETDYNGDDVEVSKDLDFLEELLEKNLNVAYTLLSTILYLDINVPKWRSKARKWKDGGRVRKLLRQLSAMFSRNVPIVVGESSPTVNAPNWFKRNLFGKREESP